LDRDGTFHSGEAGIRKGPYKERPDEPNVWHIENGQFYGDHDDERNPFRFTTEGWCSFLGGQESDELTSYQRDILKYAKSECRVEIISRDRECVSGGPDVEMSKLHFPHSGKTELHGLLRPKAGNEPGMPLVVDYADIESHMTA
jgi:hypothetical protein